MIKAIIFDFGGVLMRTEDYSLRHAWDQRLGMPIGTVERAVHHSDLWIQAQLGRVTYRAYWEGVAEMLYMPADKIPELRQDYFSGDRLNHKLVTLIRDLKAKNLQVALLSNETMQLRKKLADLQLNELFDCILISAEMGVMKPDPTAYKVALQTLHVAPYEAIFIDDSLTNIRGAQPMSIHTILFRPEVDIRAEVNRIIEEAAETK
jgi:epoxide hydrolase-like predicted phosphatase